MSWSKALLVVGLLALGPVGCGFQPMYAKPQGQAASPASTQLAGIYVAGIEDRSGQILRNALVQKINPLGEPRQRLYKLTIKLSASQEQLAESSDGKATLGRYFVRATFNLTDANGERQLFDGNSRSVASYRLLGPRYSSTATERDAQERALADVAEDIRTQLAAYFATARANGIAP